MPQCGLWMALAPLLAVLRAGMATCSPHFLCLVTYLPGRPSAAGSCPQCPQGFYCLEGGSALWSCSPRTRSGLPGPAESEVLQKEPRPQHPGYVFCPLGPCFSDRGLCYQPCPTAVSQCLQCPAGHFCPNRAAHPTPCQPGTFSPHPGQDEATACTPCPAGRACTRAGLTQPDADCTPGYVCPVGSSSPHAPTHACPPGTFSNRSDLSDVSQCEVCPSGLACARGTGGPAWPPTPCPAGYYCPRGTKVPTQFQCPPGTWSNRTGLTAGEECTPCPRGRFCVGGASVPSGTCSVGHYCPEGTKWGTQLPCPAGTYSSQAGNSQVGDCLPCPAGAFCPSGASTPVPCPRGTSRQSPGASLAVACVLCPAGHHCPELGTATPWPCSAGSFSGPGHLWCQECPGGKLCNQTKLASPPACPPGHYCPARGLLSIPCPRGTFREAPGAARLEDCQSCRPGTFCGRAGLAKPEGPCRPGHHCGPGSSTPSPEGLPFGDLCPPGHFCPAGTKDPRQRPCPAGTWNPERGAPDVSWCLPCPPGFFCAEAGQAAPSGPCAPGFYCPGGAQTQGPLGGPWGSLGPQGRTCLDGSLAATPGVNGWPLNGSGQESHQESTRPPGHHSPHDTGHPPLTCPPDMSSPRQGQSQAHGRQPCAAGAEATQPDGDIGATAGGPCPPGHFCPVGTAVPLPCPVGTFSDRMFLSRASECLSCPSGHFCGASGLAAPSGPCDPGYFCLAGVTTPNPAGRSEKGGPCPQGHFCPRGTSLPQPCPAGSYSNLTGQASCFPCPAGYYCPEALTTYSGHPCPAGFYCPRGTRYATQFPCPRGYYNPDPLTRSLDSCLPCPPGHYCGQENLTQTSGPCDAGWFCVSAAWTARPFDLDNYTSTHCLCPATATGGKCPAGSFCPKGSPEPTPCPPGSFCATTGLSTPSGPCRAGYFCAGGAVAPAPEGGLTGAPCPPGTFCPAASSRPTPCPAGTFSHLPKQTGPSECQACPAGFYCKEAGLQAPSGQCPAGYYCDARAAPVQDFSLYPCPHGYYCPLGTTIATQYSCPVGTYGPRKGLGSITECQLCPAGKFCALAGLKAPTGDCAAGHWCMGGATSQDPTNGARGLLCPAGHFCLEGTPVPAQCPPGTWSEEGSRTPGGCQPCSGERLCPDGHPPTWPAPCHPGMSCSGRTVPATPVEGLSGRVMCSPGHSCPVGMAEPAACPPGSYASSTHATKCHICPSGHYCVPGLRPQLCPRGFYCPEGTERSWQPCPAGTYGPVPGLGSLQECRACDGGRFCPGASATEAGGQCWEGFFCSRGSTRPNPEAGTEEGAGPCPRGHYCPRGSAVPQPCPPGTFSSRTKLGSEAACSPCLPGYYCGSFGLTSPSGPCSAGFFCLKGALVPNDSLGGHTSGPCPAGHFCPPGTATPRPCPAGTLSVLAAQGHCEPCPEGFFCPANTSSPEGNECPAGHYCPASTAFASQFPCPRGTYRPQRGGAQWSDCTPCEPGSYCLRPGLVAVSGPCNAGFHCIWGASLPNPTDGITGDLCPPGHFCPQGSPRPTPCPPGSLLPIPGASSREDCQPCPAGWFCSRAGLSSPEAPCEGGWFCLEASVSGHSPGSLCPPGHSCPPGSPEPQLCAPGQYQDEPGQSVCKTCPAGKFCPYRIEVPGATPLGPLDCPAGYYCPSGTQTPTQHPCPRGTFRERPGARSTGDCRPCPAGQFCSDSETGKRFPDGPCAVGHYCPPGQTSAAPSSFRCPPGFYCPEGSPQPRACENGTFQPQEAKGSCEPCPAGFYCTASGTGPAARGPRPCLQGYFCPAGSSSATAHPCPQGTFGPKREATAALDCELCPAGHYCPEGTPSPRPCPEGTLNPREGSPSSRACQPCPAGSYCPGEGNGQPMGPCSAGFYCEGGAASPTPWRHSAFPLSGPCPRGHYCPQGTLYPVPCPTGRTRSSPGGVSEDSCRPCPAGSFCPSLDLSSPPGSCVAGSECAWGPQASGPMAVLCPQGHFCLPGAAWPALCPPGEYQPSLGSDTCLQCPPGSYCPHPGTRVPTLCPAHTYCPAGTRAPPPCPPGTFTPQDTGGLREEGDCSVCPPGHYCRGGQVWGTCPAGYFCPPGTSELTAPGPSEPQTPCPQGQRCAQHCPAGFYCPEGSGGPTLCPPHTVAADPGATQQEDCRPCPAGHWCEAGALGVHPCPAGHYCPGGNRSHPGSPQPCPEHTFLAVEGGQSPAECLPCPAGYQCPSPGLSSFEDHPCPPGHWCPGGQRAFLCPPGTFRTEPGASSWKDCERCPPGYYCPGAEHSGRPSVLAVPCGAGSECPAGSVAEATCRAGSYCGPRTGVPPLCPGGYACPAGSSTYTGPGQLCRFPYYCPPGSPHPHTCPGGTEALNGSGLRVSEDTCCSLCEAGTYRPRALAALPCQPCPPGFSCQQGTESYHSQPCPVGHYCPAGTRSPRPCPSGTFRNRSGAGAAGDCVHCPAGTFSAQPGQAGCLPCGSSAFSPPGATHCTCRGLNSVFQESDSSCICRAGHESLDESSGDADCQPQVVQRCSPGDVRLAATRICVSPQRHDCSSFCHPVGGELSAGLGICRCREYISAEELCDTQCLARAPQLSLVRGPSRKLTLIVKGEAGDSVQREVVSTLGPDGSFQGSARVHLVQCGPRGLLGFIISSADMLGSLLLGSPASRPRRRRRHWTAGPEPATPQGPSIHPHIPNPVICLLEGDVILFQLHILRHNRSASHYPVYQKQHLFNSNPDWDFGAFRRLDHLVRETGLTFSRFAHQFLDPGTYVFRDNGQPESMAVVLVKGRGAACEPGLAPVQPSSPSQLARHGVLMHRLPNLGPDWAAISGVLLAVGLATVLLTGLGLLLRPSLPAQARPTGAWRPQWRGLGEPRLPTGDVASGDSLLLSEDLGPWGSEEGASCTGKATTRGAGKPLLATTLEDLSVRTLYDKLEDQSLHMAAQLCKLRSDALAFYRGVSRQLQGLQGLSAAEQPGPGRAGDPESEARAAARTHAGQREAAQGSLTAASRRVPRPRPPGGTLSTPAPGRQPELDRAIAGLAAALSQTREPPAGASRQASAQLAERLLSARQQDPELASDALPQPRPPPSHAQRQSTSPQQQPGPGRQSRGDDKGGDTQHPGLAHRQRAFPEIQRKIRQVEDNLDALNEEFFQLAAQALALRKEEDQPGQPPLVEDRQDPAEAGESLGTWALRSHQALALEAQRGYLAQRADDLEWELALLLQVAAVWPPGLARC